MDGTTFLGLVAGTLTTVAFFPQFLKAWRSKSTKDISLIMYVVISTGILLWLVYGVLIHSLPVIVANAVTIVIALAILVLKIRYK
ncbi:MAG: SemiSWEET transporter [Candidatus Zixiibacteriota bacterium]